MKVSHDFAGVHCIEPESQLEFSTSLRRMTFSNDSASNDVMAPERASHVARCPPVPFPLFNPDTHLQLHTNEFTPAPSRSD